MPINQYALLAPPPRSGQLSLTGKRLIAELFIFIASMIIMAVVADNYAKFDCTGLCGFYVFMAVFSFIISFILLAINVCIELRIAKRSMLPFQKEKNVLLFFFGFWIIGIILFNLNSNPFKFQASGQALVTFAWLLFLTSGYVNLLMYHILLEQGLYKDLTKKWEAELQRHEEEVALGRRH
ncbi:hypothetical protein NDN08_005260 [Rhodosorus marinus]|uniref:MARVEL domain-containing protein n=1 Tax=Rhodosorus marinus TaxID=101924 RepID=A0AAV8V130_9RHOD|nr:hypothetical protein NDN08_005260 [Rhodosorus marinus]